jgi:hypothetical protein
MRSFAIHIYNNAVAHKEKVEKICADNEVKIGPLFEAIVEHMTYAEWNRYAELARKKKVVGKNIRGRLTKSIKKLDASELESLLVAMRAQGLVVDEAEE